MIFEMQGRPTLAQGFKQSRFGVWGRVRQTETSRDSSKNRVDVELNGGLVLRSLPVASMEWTQNSSDNENGYAIGERNLPMPGTRVFVMMPTGDFSSAFVLCSGFADYSGDANAPFYADNKEWLRERVRPAGKTGDDGWHTKYDVTTGSFEITSPDAKTAFKVDYGENGQKKDNPEIAAKIFDEVSLSHKGGDSVELKIYKTTLKIDKDGNVEVSTEKDVSVSTTKGDVAVSTNSGNIEAKTASGNATIEATGGTVQLKGQKVQIGGTVTPSGSGALCGIPACLFTGAPHTGEVSMGA